MPVKPATPSAVLQVGTTEVRLWELPFSIGRSSKNTLTIRDRHLSRSHCEIDQTSDGFAIRNLSDLNPTLVNDKEIQTRLLVDGDEIRVHDHKFIFRLDREDLDEPVKGDTVIRTSPGRVQTTGPEDQTAGAPPQTTGPEDQATAPEASSDAESAASPRPKASGVAAGAVPAPTPQSKDQPLAPVVIAGLLFFGLFGMAGLMLHQNGQSNQMTAQVIQELSGMQQEFGALHKEIQTAREVYLEESKRNNEAWKKLLATRSQSPRVVSQPRQHTPRPTPQKAPTPPTKKKPIQASEKPPAPTKTPPSPANKPPTTASKKNPTPAPATPKGGSQDVTRSTSPKQQPQPAKQQASSAKKDTTQQPKHSKGVSFFGHQISKKHVVFVLDKSSSMKPVMGRLHQEMESAIDAMTPTTNFTIIFFDDVPHLFSRKMMPASTKYKRFAKTFVRRQQAQGYTDPIPALKAALAYPKLDGLVFLTDGNINPQEFSFLKSMLTSMTSGKGFKGRKIRLYLVPVVRNDRIDELLNLAKKQKF